MKNIMTLINNCVCNIIVSNKAYIVSGLSYPSNYLTLSIMLSTFNFSLFVIRGSIIVLAKPFQTHVYSVINEGLEEISFKVLDRNDEIINLDEVDTIINSNILSQPSNWVELQLDIECTTLMSNTQDDLRNNIRNSDTHKELLSKIIANLLKTGVVVPLSSIVSEFMYSTTQLKSDLYLSDSLAENTLSLLLEDISPFKVYVFREGKITNLIIKHNSGDHTMSMNIPMIIKPNP